MASSSWTACATVGRQALIRGLRAFQAMALLELDRLSKSFVTRRGPAVVALADVSLTVRPGEILVLLGPSGSGKTTTLRLIAGLESPSSGEVRMDGRSMTQVPPDQRGVAMVFQDQPLFSHLSTRENLALPLRLQKKSANEIAVAVSQIAEVLRLESLLDCPSSSLSGGEHRRVALGMAMLKQPRVLLLDEPWVHLDPRLRSDLRHELRLLQRRRGFTVLLVTHDREEAMALGDRLAVLHRGSLLQVGTPLDVYQQPGHAVVADGMGRYPVNWLRGRWRHDGASVHFVADDLPSWALPAPAHASPEALHPDRRVLLGLRPESLRPIPYLGSPEFALRGTVEAVENLGVESLLRCRSETVLWTARVESGRETTVGQNVTLGFDPAEVLWFDAATSQRLSHSSVR
ncbi:MAG: ABC transporter ATP-binding protein [Verrucomicrobiales bacterium]|nr:ABC transporter ATP-binding protein [Verrucomicrobiales bacterium]